MPPHAGPLTAHECVPAPTTQVIVSKRQRNSKRISWGEEQNRIHEITHINDLKQEADITDIWYTRKEYAQISKNCCETVEQEIQSMIQEEQTHQHQQNDQDEWCLRGLELKLESTLACQYHDFPALRLCRRRRSVEAVLDEDDLQRTEGIYDDELLADIYYDCSYDSQIESERIGWSDYLESLQLWKD